MQLVERHIIKKNHQFFSECDELSFKAKNLYNTANYFVRQEFINNKKYISSFELQKIFQGTHEAYTALPAKISQQTLRLLHRNWISFFKAIKDWKIHPKKYLGRPKLPKYKKKDGRSVVIYDLQAISKKKLKKNKIALSQTNIELDFQHDITKVKQARIIPKNQYQYVIEIVYEHKEPNLKQGEVLGVDLGVNNLCAISSKNEGVLINGRPLKAMNQFYNKDKAKLQSQLPKNQDTSNQIVRLTNKRNNKVNDYLHKTSRQIITYCLTNNIGEIVIGHNPEWKQSVNLGRRNNQKFVQIPFKKLIDMISYKARLEGISVTLQEESYTSKCSFFDREEMKHHSKYVGKRKNRGLFQTASGHLINADINGSLNIIRKSNPQFSIERIEAVAVRPKRLRPFK